MIPRWASLDEAGQSKYWAMRSFLKSRLMERDTLDWAIKQDKNAKVKRMVLSDLIEDPYDDDVMLKEPWRGAWEVVVESWDAVGEADDDLSAIHLQRRLQRGERSEILLRSIVRFFGPRLSVGEHRSFGEVNKPKKARAIWDLVSVGVSGGNVGDLQYIQVADIEDVQFLGNLAHAIERAIESGFEIARRTGWGDDPRFMVAAHVKSVAYLGQSDPDEFARGFEAPIKLLHSTVDRIATLDRGKAMPYMRRWRNELDPLNCRLWASMAERWPWIEADEVGDFLLDIDDRVFWEAQTFPEIAELRARKFKALKEPVQDDLWGRIRRLPPKTLWLHGHNAAEILGWRYRAAYIETLRIDQEGGAVPLAHMRWMVKARKVDPNLSNLGRVSSAYQEGARAFWGAIGADERLDSLKGEERLSTIEKAFMANERTDSIFAWIRFKNNLRFLVEDFTKSSKSPWFFSRTWEQFCLEHKPKEELYKVEDEAAKQIDYQKVLSWLLATPEDRLLAGAKAFSEWLGSWATFFQLDEKSVELWSRLIGPAERSTEEDSRKELNQPLKLAPNDPLDDDALIIRNRYSPMGWLVEVFVRKLPNLNDEPNAFKEGGYLFSMRSRLMSCERLAREIVLCRFVEQLSYLLHADRTWTRQALIEPLLSENDISRKMWASLSYRTLSKDALEFIGDSIILPCLDAKLSRQARHNLVLSVIVECLNAYMDGGRDPFLSKPRVAQLLYTLDDEARARAAEVLSRYLIEVPKAESADNRAISPEYLFATSVKPFLEEYWPKDLSLLSPAVANAFADLPVTTRGCFVEAVDAIERYLMPFDCYSIYAFGLRDAENGINSMKDIIASPAAAEALLRMLDKSIAYTEQPIRPSELADVLSQIRTIDPTLEEDARFLRLSMLLS